MSQLSVGQWGRAVDREFFQQDTEILARALLGTILAHETPEGLTAGRVVEVEMYRGAKDRAAHSYRGVPTARTQVMFGPPGHAYVYFIYGMHYCLNVVAAPDGVGEAILLRALEPIAGLELMAKRRRLAWPLGSRAARNLTNGPGKLASALSVSKAQYGLPLWSSSLRFYQGESPLSMAEIREGPRINIGYAGEAAHYPWRFWIQGNPFVSRT